MFMEEADADQPDLHRNRRCAGIWDIVRDQAA
jgi:hypothetical protein